MGHYKGMDGRPEIKLDHPRQYHRIPVRLNFVLVAGIAGLNFAQFIILPGLLLPLDVRWGLLLIPIALVTSMHWALIHESIHAIIHPVRVINDRLGRVLSVLFGAPFQILRLGHLMHHRFNRTELDRAEVMDATGLAAIHAWFGYYARLLAGLYLAEALSCLAVLLPKSIAEQIAKAVFGGKTADGRKMAQVVNRQLFEKCAWMRLRFDGVMVLILLGLSLFLYGDAWWMLAAALLGRAFLISFFDNAYHYGTPLNSVQSALNLRLPKLLALGMLNFNLHAVHHRQPALPWINLRSEFHSADDFYADEFVGATLRQLRGPLRRHDIPDTAVTEMS